MTVIALPRERRRVPRERGRVPKERGRVPREMGMATGHERSCSQMHTCANCGDCC